MDGITIDVLTSIDEIDGAAYDALHRDCGAPAFYDRRFLQAAERSPLLPYEQCWYLVARNGHGLLGVLPAYLQSAQVVDPFGLLAKSTSVRFRPQDMGLFSHVMHCSDTRVLAREPVSSVYRELIARLAQLAAEVDVPHFAIMNVSDPSVLAAANTLGLEVSHMVDRYWIDLTSIKDLKDLIDRHLSKDGRREMRRQLRKFEASDARLVLEEPPFDNLEEFGALCHDTTARNGTPNYLPAAALTRFVDICGGLARLVSVYSGSQRLGTCVLLLERDVLHCWLGGMTYAPGEFSPYTVLFAGVYRYALQNGYRRVEAGRLNVRIKTRLGLSPLALHAIVNPRPALVHSGNIAIATSHSPSLASLQ